MIHKFQLIDRVFMTVTEKGSTLTIRSAKKEDSGQYMCQVPNGQLDPQKLILRLVIMVSMMRIQNIKDIRQHIFTYHNKPHHQYPKNTIYKNIITNAMTNFVSVITIYCIYTILILAALYFALIFKSKLYFRLTS